MHNAVPEGFPIEEAYFLEFSAINNPEKNGQLVDKILTVSEKLGYHYGHKAVCAIMTH